MELNNTPIRTSKNFNINNIKLDVEIPAVTERNRNIHGTSDYSGRLSVCPEPAWYAGCN